MIKHKIALAREKNVTTKDFRELASEIATLLTYEATKDLETEKEAIQGWAGPVQVEKIKGKKITVVPILRAGLGMMPGVLNLIPSAKVSIVGLYRNEETPTRCATMSSLPRTWMSASPSSSTRCSPPAAQPWPPSICQGVRCKQIKGICMVAAPEGIRRVEKAHPDVAMYVAPWTEKLNDIGYILPGLGDAGDKISARNRYHRQELLTGASARGFLPLGRQPTIRRKLRRCLVEPPLPRAATSTSHGELLRKEESPTAVDVPGQRPALPDREPSGAGTPGRRPGLGVHAGDTPLAPAARTARRGRRATS